MLKQFRGYNNFITIVKDFNRQWAMDGVDSLQQSVSCHKTKETRHALSLR
ncbi:MAG: hypothetical protein QM768_09130 [Agriterribacter sp.]